MRNRSVITCVWVEGEAKRMDEDYREVSVCAHAFVCVCAREWVCARACENVFACVRECAFVCVQDIKRSAALGATCHVFLFSAQGHLARGEEGEWKSGCLIVKLTAHSLTGRFLIKIASIVL